MRLNENALNVPAYAMGFRVFCIETAFTLRAYRGVLSFWPAVFSFFIHGNNMVYFHVSLHNMYYQNY